jgi:hypothetical protein
MKRIRAVLTLIRPLAPKPWMMRAAVSVGSDQLNAHSRDAPVKTARPQI